MSRPVLILGGGGNFGKRIAAQLCAGGIPVVLSGRDRAKLDAVASRLPKRLARVRTVDVRDSLAGVLDALKPVVVVNTCGPFQTADYAIARCCVTRRVPYVDIADGRGYVRDITCLDADAREAGVAVISGASTVPCLSSAVLEHFRAEYANFDALDYGISPGQQAERGLATTKGILGYVGRRLEPAGSNPDIRYGWQGIHRVEYPGLGWRWMGHCDIPDLDLFPARYGLRTIRFAAGLELAPLHLGLWALSWLVRLGWPLALDRHAKALLRTSKALDRFGSADGGMHMFISGRDAHGKARETRWYIVARGGSGPYIPTVPAVILATRIAAGKGPKPGARACVGLVTLDAYLDQLAAFPIETMESRQAQQPVGLRQS